MLPFELLGTGFVLLLTLSLGLIAHELMHALVLHSFGISYDIRWFPGRGGGGSRLDCGLFGTWATVTPRLLPQDVPTWSLQLSAIAPLVLAAPFGLVFLGILPDPLHSNIFVTAATIAWLGAALPSPQDFSLFWHADSAIDEHEVQSLEKETG